MYIDPFLAGVLATICTECVLIVVLAVSTYFKDRRNDNDGCDNYYN